MRILVVEDDPILSDGLRAGLGLGGATVDCVGTCVDAEAALATSAFSAIVLDLMLPDGSGLDVLRGLRGRKDRTPVVLLTARDAVADRIAGRAGGAASAREGHLDDAGRGGRLPDRLGGVPADRAVGRPGNLDGRRTVGRPDTAQPTGPKNKKSKARGLAFKLQWLDLEISLALAAGRSLFLPRLGPCATSSGRRKHRRTLIGTTIRVVTGSARKICAFLPANGHTASRLGSGLAAAGPPPPVRRDYAPPWSRSACNLRLRRVVCRRAAAPPGRSSSKTPKTCVSPATSCRPCARRPRKPRSSRTG